MTNTHSDDGETADWLLTPEAVRIQCHDILDRGLCGGLPNFTLDMEKLDAVAERVCATIRETCPDLKVPPHARWRHFMIDGEDRWSAHAMQFDDLMERARVEFELAVTSVLLDADGGPDWRFRDEASGRILAGSEGLALASLGLFVSGAFSSDEAKPLRADVNGLSRFDETTLARGFQVADTNPLEGLAGRAALLSNVGEAVLAMPQVFGSEEPRLGNLVDYLFGHAVDGKLDARTILITLLHALGRIWSGRPHVAGRNLGDTWPHPAAGKPGLVPFHTLSQRLTYSLIEPLERAGLAVTGQEALTGLADHQNGGLFIDLGVIVPRDPSIFDHEHVPDANLVVEWRALTVGLLDAVVPLVRESLGLNERVLPLARVLEGGTWPTGRKVASEMREGGAPPIAIETDGSVF